MRYDQPLYNWLCLYVVEHTLGLIEHGRHFADIFKLIVLYGSRILVTISQKFVPKGPVDNILTLVQKMAWRCMAGEKPLSEPMMA